MPSGPGARKSAVADFDGARSGWDHHRRLRDHYREHVQQSADLVAAWKA